MLLTYNLAPEMFVIALLLVAILFLCKVIGQAWRGLVRSWDNFEVACAVLRVTLRELREDLRLTIQEIRDDWRATRKSNATRD